MAKLNDRKPAKWEVPVYRAARISDRRRLLEEFVEILCACGASVHDTPCHFGHAAHWLADQDDLVQAGREWAIVVIAQTKAVR